MLHRHIQGKGGKTHVERRTPQATAQARSKASAGNEIARQGDAQAVIPQLPRTVPVARLVRKVSVGPSSFLRRRDSPGLDAAAPAGAEETRLLMHGSSAFRFPAAFPFACLCEISQPPYTSSAIPKSSPDSLCNIPRPHSTSIRSTSQRFLRPCSGAL